MNKFCITTTVAPLGSGCPGRRIWSRPRRCSRVARKLTRVAFAGRLIAAASTVMVGLSACGLTMAGQQPTALTRISEQSAAQSVLVVITDPESPATLTATRSLVSMTGRPGERLVIIDAHSGALLAATTAPMTTSISVSDPLGHLTAGSTSYQRAEYLKAIRQYHSAVRRASSVLRRRQHEMLASWARSTMSHLAAGMFHHEPSGIDTQAALMGAAADFSSLQEAGISANSHSVVVIMVPSGVATGAVPDLPPQLQNVTVVVSGFTGSSTDQAAWQAGLLQTGARRVVLLTPATQSQLPSIVRQGLDGAVIDTLTNVLFASGSYRIQPGAAPQLSRLLHLLTVIYPTATASINGYTDNIPAHAPGGNLRLSLLRARAVEAWLSAHGVAATRMQATGYGDIDPVAPNTADGQPLNRRVVIVIDPVTAS
jgi:outer membrane protein OmpA-like peptidoglycan-associated protein